ncbi:MAG: PDGLE domain-containing protein [Actinomycetota bacterium]|nr:PDGLE domain-containing protein [Actinomycetota bacterium]
MSTRRFFVAFALVALLLAGVATFVAASSPDGLQRVATDRGISHAEEEHALRNSPFAGYGTRGVDDPGLSGAVAGVVGVGVTLLLAGGLFLVVRRRGGPEA